ncbi:MAG: hypothetical protein SFY68_10525 [Candidatus Sumerlaeia bacterium]|nr:hypothetical protein [Candidatus Sumerlaeia bacterium]
MQQFVEHIQHAESLLLQRPGVVAAPLPAELGHAVSTKGQKETVNSSHAFSSPMWRWLRRNVITDGNQTLIYNLAAFPHPGVDAPLVEAEIVILRGKLFVLILDAHPLSAAPGEVHAANAILSPLPGVVPELPPVAERPPWAEGCISANAFWSQPMTPEAVEPALNLLPRFFESVVAAVGSPSPVADPTERRQALHGLLMHLQQHAPSKSFLSAFFGEEWTQRYVQEFFLPARLFEGD